MVMVTVMAMVTVMVMVIVKVIVIVIPVAILAQVQALDISSPRRMREGRGPRDAGGLEQPLHGSAPAPII